MNFYVAKKIDHFIGVPVCFFFSFFERLKKVFFPRKGTNELPKKILFIELSEIGSVILSYSAVEKAKKEYQNADIYFWIFKENSEILCLLDFIPYDNILLMRSRNIFVLFIDILRNLRKIQREKIDTVIDMELFSRFSSILGYLSRARIRVGFHEHGMKGAYRGGLHTRKVIYNPRIHISRNFESLVDSLKFSSEHTPLIGKQQQEQVSKLPEINIDEREKEKILHRLQEVNSSINEKSKIVIMHIGFEDKVYIRRWPVKCCLELLQRVLQSQNVFVVIIGLGSENRGTELFKHERCLNLIGKTTIRELLALFSISQVLVSHDSGIVHVASLTNINIVVLFGPETPALYRPLAGNIKIFYKNLECSPCLTAFNQRISNCENNICITSITVDEVYGEVNKII